MREKQRQAGEQKHSRRSGLECQIQTLYNVHRRLRGEGGGPAGCFLSDVTLLCQEEYHYHMMTRCSCTADTWIRCAWFCKAKSQHRHEGFSMHTLSDCSIVTANNHHQPRLVTQPKAKQVMIPGVEGASTIMNAAEHARSR